MQTQASGLATRLAEYLHNSPPNTKIIAKTVTMPRWMAWMKPHWAASLIKPDKDMLGAKIVISCGRRSEATSIALRQLTEAFTIHIQSPHTKWHHFDAVVAPQHDFKAGDTRLNDPDIKPFISLGAVHDITQERLESARKEFMDPFQAMKQPRIAVLIGGNSRTHTLTPAIADHLCQTLRKLAEDGAGLMISFSRRTPDYAKKQIATALEAYSPYIWPRYDDKSPPPNPYKGLLAWADYIFVTHDSASMVSEATAARKPVYLLSLKGTSKKFDRFHDQMIAAGLVRKFDGKLENWQPPALDETGRIAHILAERIQQRISVTLK